MYLEENSLNMIYLYYRYSLCRFIFNIMENVLRRSVRKRVRFCNKRCSEKIYVEYILKVIYFYFL